MSFDSDLFWNKASAIKSESEFNEYALELFRYQAANVYTYGKYLSLLATDIDSISHYMQIPFLPVSVFKTAVLSDQKSPVFYFSSSGTSGQETSKHFVPDTGLYSSSLLKSFKLFYGDPREYCFFALLPSYLERPGSSLVFMMEELMKASANPEGGFFLYDHDKLFHKITEAQKSGKKIFLIGVTYALLDFFENFSLQLSDAIVMETGGMKGNRKEIIREEIHAQLQINSGCDLIHSEYGMTEMLSQCYSNGNGLFDSPPWIRIIVGDLHDPFSIVSPGVTGKIKVIDLANIHSCAFLETQDLGRKTNEGKFEVLGRMDNSELRGCNLMVVQ